MADRSKDIYVGDAERAILSVGLHFKIGYDRGVKVLVAIEPSDYPRSAPWVFSARFWPSGFIRGTDAELLRAEIARAKGQRRKLKHNFDFSESHCCTGVGRLSGVRRDDPSYDLPDTVDQFVERVLEHLDGPLSDDEMAAARRAYYDGREVTEVTSRFDLCRRRGEPYRLPVRPQLELAF